MDSGVSDGKFKGMLQTTGILLNDLNQRPFDHKDYALAHCALDTQQN